PGLPGRVAPAAPRHRAVFPEACGSLPCFVQAQGGIRDDLVTGVQTCALPISVPAARSSSRPDPRVSRPIRTAPPPCQSVTARPKIGRASCRERVWPWVGAGALKRKTIVEGRTQQKDAESWHAVGEGWWTWEMW